MIPVLCFFIMIVDGTHTNFNDVPGYVMDLDSSPLYVDIEDWAKKNKLGLPHYNLKLNKEQCREGIK